MTIYTSPDQFEDQIPSVGQRFGTALGSGMSEGLSSGLQILAQDKVEEMKHQRLQNLISGLSRGQTSGKEEEISQTSKAPDPREMISDERILAVSQIDPNAARLLQSQKESQVKQTESKIKREFERAKPILGRADERAEEIAQKESSLSLMENAIQEGDQGFFSLNNLADVTGIEGLRTPKGAQFISSGKEYFLGSLRRAGPRPNQWIEQQIQKMLPKIGRSEEANQTVIEALKSELSIEKAHLDIIDRLSEEDEKKFGYVRGNIGQRTRKELKTFAEAEQKDLEIRLKAIQPSSYKIKTLKDEVLMYDPSGKLRKLKKSDAIEAKKEGYTLYK